MKNRMRHQSRNPVWGVKNRLSSSRTKKFTILLFISWLCASARIMAVPACPEGAKVTQPDGTEITIYLRGDEYRHWHESKDGFLIAKSAKSGEWVYMVKEAGAAVASSHAVGKADPGTSGALMPNKEKLSAEAALSRAEKLAAGKESALAPPTGTMYNLVVLVNFSDLTVAYPRQSYDDLFNQVGYIADGAVGSVKDYYHEVSYNTLTVQSTVVEAVTLDHGYAYYGANDIYGDDIRPREMVAEALAKLEARGFDFSTVDGDMDGWVDGLTIIHAGGGEEYSGNDTNYIWSHQWALSNVVTYDGISMLMYHTEPARRGWDSSPSTQGITRIGVICHETGHFLGLPDLYDYGYDSEGAGNFCLMAGGSWNGDYGTTPAHTSAWCKSSLGWISPTLISSNGVYSLGQAETNAQVYKLQGTFPSTQYFLVENRQGVGFDAAIPGSHRGILIWHVDETQPDNDDQTHYKVDLEEASGTQHLALNQNAGDDADYFRAGNATVFTGSSTPNNLSYTGQPLKVNITNVGASGASMSVSVDCPIVVEIMGSWVTGLTHAKETTGTNRALVFVAHAESSSSSTSLTGVTYGGRSMTKITDKIIGSGSSQAYVAAFILNESGIVAATDTTFTLTWTSAPSSVTYTSVFLKNVNQTTLVGATANNGVTNFKSISISSSLATSNGDMVIEDAASSVTGTYTVTTGWTKDVDLSVSGYDGMDGHKPATGASETPSVSQSKGSHVLIGFVVQIQPQQYTLTINTVGNGTVAKSPDKTTYTYGEVVTLTANPAVGWSFSAWSGDLTGSTNPTTITMNGSKSVTATFTQNQYALTISTVGGGSVAKSPDKTTYTYGEVVTLTANPAVGWSFSAWSGDLSGSDNPATLTIDGNKSVTATFTQNQYALTISTVGSGSVAKSPDKTTYTYGEVVTLTANPAVGWSFSAWSGDLTGSTNPTTITMNGSKSVAANFEWAPAWTLSDNFNDGLKSAMWFRSIDDYDNVWVTEDANSLNLRSIGEVTEPGNYAGYAANGWTYDVSEDFTARVDFHYSAVDSYNGWIGITVGNNDANYVSILVGSEDNQAYLYYEKVVDANVVSSDRVIRTSNDGTLYISYSAAADELYVSTVGYGAANAWQTAAGLLQGQWVSGTVYVSIGGGGVCDGIAAGGQARLDNFETAAGKIVGWPPATDLDSDGFIGLGDFIILAENWLSPGPAADFNGDGIVDMRDFDRLALAW